jgi:G3E family GTPase
MSNTPIPVAILTGFLGAGKTTLLNFLLKDPFLGDAAVIINEFGDVGIDHLLVERADENVIEMASGCLCCTIRGDLIDTIHDLLARRGRGEIRPFNRIVIETTGLADPAPVLHAVMSEPGLLAACRLEGVITVVDAFNGMATLDAHPEAVKQAAVADRIVLTKVDLLVGREGEDMLFAIIGRLRKLNPGARLLTTHRNEATAERLFTMGLFDPRTKTADVQGWLAAEAYETGEKRGRRRHAHAHDHEHDHGHVHGHGHHHDTSRHDDHIRSFSFTEANAISPQGLELFLELLKSYHGANMLRMKGIV